MLIYFFWKDSFKKETKHQEVRILKKRKTKKYKRYIRKQIKKALQEKNSECKILESVTSDLTKVLDDI